MAPPHIVPIQLKNFTPVGTAMSIENPVKNGSSTAPVTKRWCAHTPTDRVAIAIVATRPAWPNTGRRENTGRTSVITPKDGNTRM